MSRSRLTSVAWAAGLVAAAWALPACSPGEPAGPPALSVEQATQEFREEAGTLQLAPGSQWPEKPLRAAAEDGAAMVYEPGFGRQAADSHWFCSWSGRVLDVAVSEKQRTAAVAELEKIRSLYFYTKALAPESRPVLDDILASTKLGDLAPLRRDHELNCAYEPVAG